MRTRRPQSRSYEAPQRGRPPYPGDHSIELFGHHPDPRAGTGARRERGVRKVQRGCGGVESALRDHEFRGRAIVVRKGTGRS